jgi:hypothetical protein
LAWLKWKSDGCERGIRGHKVDQDGSIIEVYNPAPEPRRKSKRISSRQWEGR